MKRKYVWMCKTAKKVPLWMYYVRELFDIFEAIITMFLLPFHRQIDITTWILVKILKAGVKQIKQKGG